MTGLREIQDYVSVAGCLGYDVLGSLRLFIMILILVSVAGCLGYDVLAAPQAQSQLII